jgi:hypothetical protein
MTYENGKSTNGVAPESEDGADAVGRGGPFDLSAQRKRVLLAILVVHVIVARFTLRDLRRRPESAVRGPKRLWRLWATLNTTGSLAYWLVGRSRGDTDPAA